MKAAVDLHIHSALSPCADKDMTPNNIVNMAFLKGLDIIAVTDHNSAGNIEAVMKCARKKGLLAVPGMEVETREEVHVLCLFCGLREALKMQETIYKALPEIKNREDIFGQQLIIDDEDNVVRTEDKLLLNAVSMGLDDIAGVVGKLGGVMIPAHVDRASNSIISNLGMIPDGLDIKYLEVSKFCSPEGLRKRSSFIDKFRLLRSSDAHYLGDILERESFVELEELSTECLIAALKGVERGTDCR